MAPKISIIIPNYNGKDLLVKNLPNVIKNSPSAEIIVVDDASIDDSVNVLKENFKKIIVITHKKNGSFSFFLQKIIQAETCQCRKRKYQ